MKTICTWLAEDAGITLSVTSLTSYISRIRPREIQECQSKAIGDLGANVLPVKPVESVAQEPGFRVHGPANSSSPNTDSLQKQIKDPFAQAMHALSKPKFDIREIHGDGDPNGKNLI
jgi:hypothetical protein